MMEAPVGRTSDHAIAGTLLIMAGGTKEQLDKAEPLFRLMGSDIVDAGGPGKGIRIKIINNYMSIALNALSAEGDDPRGSDWSGVQQCLGSDRRHASW